MSFEQEQELIDILQKFREKNRIKKDYIITIGDSILKIRESDIDDLR